MEPKSHFCDLHGGEILELAARTVLLSSGVVVSLSGGVQRKILMNSPPEQARIDCRIEDLVQEHWTEHKAPLLLSRLGSLIRPDEAAAIKKESENLAAFVREKLVGRVEVIQSSQNAAVIAAVPADVMEDSNIDVDAILSGTLRRSEIPRFHPAFWAAFVKEPTLNARRYVSAGPPPRFQEFSDGTTPSDPDAIKIDSEYIVGTHDDVAKVHSSIRRWLIANSLDESLFLSDEESRHRQLPSDDLFGRLIMSLTPEELKRMSIPLDIASKLRRQSV